MPLLALHPGSCTDMGGSTAQAWLRTKRARGFAVLHMFCEQWKVSRSLPDESVVCRLDLRVA